MVLYWPLSRLARGESDLPPMGQGDRMAHLAPLAGRGQARNARQERGQYKQGPRPC
jgi:hypothetical protein